MYYARFLCRLLYVIVVCAINSSEVTSSGQNSANITPNWTKSTALTKDTVLSEEKKKAASSEQNGGKKSPFVLGSVPKKDLASNAQQGFVLKISGKFGFVTILGKNKETWTTVFDPKPSTAVFNFSGLFNSGSRMYSHTANSQMNVNNSQFTVRAEQPFLHEKATFAAFMSFTGDPNSKQSVREIAFEIDSTFGTFVAGNTKGPENRAVAGPTNFFGGTGNVDGAFSRFLNSTTGVYMYPSMKGDTGVATKMIYFSPNFGDIKRYGAVQFGFAYTPNTSMTGEAKMNTAFNSKDPLKQNFDMNNFTQSVRYSLEREKFGLNASFVRIQANTKAIIPEQHLLQPYNNNSWDVALDTHYGPWHIGAEYIYNGKSGDLRNNLPEITPTLVSDAGQSEVLPTLMYNSQAVGRSATIATGVGYIIPNRWGVCLGFLRNSRNTGFMQPDASGSAIKAKGTAWVLSLDRSLLDGVEYFVEVAISYKMSNPAWPYIGSAGAALTKMPFTTSPGNSAAGVLSGLKIKF